VPDTLGPYLAITSPSLQYAAPSAAADRREVRIEDLAAIFPWSHFVYLVDDVGRRRGFRLRAQEKLR